MRKNTLKNKLAAHNESTGGHFPQKFFSRFSFRNVEICVKIRQLQELMTTHVIKVWSLEFGMYVKAVNVLLSAFFKALCSKTVCWA